MNEEIMQVLRMVEKNKISADEASKLIQAIETSTAKDQWIDLNDDDLPEAKPSGKKARWLHVMVDESAGDKKKNVRIRIPIGLARWALKFVPKTAQSHIKEKHGADFDFDEIAEMIDELPVGEDIINVIDEDTGERVRIFIS